MEDSQSKSSARRGELWAFGSVLGYASANIFDRVAVRDADRLVGLVGPLVRGLPSLLLGLILVWQSGRWRQLRASSECYLGRRALASLVWAGVVSTLGLFAYYFAIRIGGVIITIPVLQTYGIWGALIAWYMLGERLGVALALGLGLVAGGVAALSWGQLRGHPISPHWYWAIPLTIVAAFTYGVAGALWRDAQLRGAHQSTSILVQFTASMAVALVVPAVSGHLPRLMTTPGSDLAALFASGVLSGIVGVYCMFMALRLMSVARVFAYSGLTPLVAALAAHFLLHEYLSVPMFAGVLLTSSGVAVTQTFRPAEERQAQ